MYHSLKRLSILLFLLVPVMLLGQIEPSYSGRPGMLNEQAKEEFIPTFSSTGVIDAKSYYLGPGDVLFVSLIGASELKFDLVVDPEGYVFIPGHGLLKMHNHNLFEGKEIITKTLKSMFSDVQIDISLKTIRQIKVDVIGYISKPSSYIIPANSRLSDLVVSLGELPENCDLRNIELTDVNLNVKSCDLLKYRRLGDIAENPYLMNINSVKLARADRTVQVLGAVKYPGIYELVENETASEIISICGGMLERAYRDTVELVKYYADKKSQYSKYYTYNELLTNDVLLENGDMLMVRSIPYFLYERTVTINGEVNFPGTYKIQEGKTNLYDLIMNETGGFKKEASLKDAYVQRTTGMDRTDYELERIKTIPRADMSEDEYEYLKARSRERKGRMTVDFVKLFVDGDMEENLVLKRGDIISIPVETDYITVVGQVVNPGNIVYKPDYTVDDYIRLTGGFAWRAVESDVRVIRSTNGEWVEADEVDLLLPGDIVWIPEEAPPAKFWDVFRDVTFVVGQFSALVASIIAIIIATR